MESPEHSKRIPSDDQKRNDNDRAYKAENEQRDQTGAPEPASPAENGLPKDCGNERQRNVDIRELVQVCESADATGENDHRGINVPVKCKPNQNHQEKA